MSEPLLSVEDLKKYFPVTRGVFGKKVGDVRAVDGVSFDIAVGETLGLVGESGSGKTTVGRSILRLLEPTSGRITFDGVDVTHASEAELAPIRRHLQVIFQDPYSSLNPRMRVVDIVGEALEVHGILTGQALEKRVAELLTKVGLSKQWINRYPHEFSGGQRQRIGVARAIALEPKLIVCDEAVSALDVSIQAQVINLLTALRREMGLSYLFIAHDLSVVRHISNRIAVMYVGQIVEHATTKRLFDAPAHPYTRALLSAIPVPVPRRDRLRIVLSGDVPSPANPPSGCRFHTRCPSAFDRCPVEEPEAVTVEGGHSVKCFHAYDLDGADDWYRLVVERIDAAARKNAGTASSEAAKPAPRTATDGHDSTRKIPRPRHQRGETQAGPATLQSVARFAICLGAFSLGLGFWFVGLALAATSYLAVLRPKLSKKSVADALFTLAVLACALVGFSVTEFERRLLAERQMDLLVRALGERQRNTGDLPRNLGELGWRLFPIFENGKPLDPWGQPYVYRVGSGDGRRATFDLCSSEGATGANVGQHPRCGIRARASTLN